MNTKRIFGTAPVSITQSIYWRQIDGINDSGLSKDLQQNGCRPRKQECLTTLVICDTCDLMVIVANSLIVVTRLCKYSDRDTHIHTKMHMTLAVHQQSKLHSFNGLFSRTISVSQYQKGKSSLDLNEARDDGIWGAYQQSVL